MSATGEFLVWIPATDNEAEARIVPAQFGIGPVDAAEIVAARDQSEDGGEWMTGSRTYVVRDPDGGLHCFESAANRDALDRARVRGIKRSMGGRRRPPSITLPAISIQKRGE